MSRPALRLATQPLSAERQALADAIAEAAPLRAMVDEARARAEAARGAMALALEAGPAAEREVDEARARLVADPGADRGELRRLRAAVADTADDLAIARDVAERAEAALVEADRTARYATERIEAAADVVLVTCFDEALQAAVRVGHEFARLAFVAGTIAQAGNHWNGERTRMMGAVATLNPASVFGNDQRDVPQVQEAAAAPWRAARAALLVDPAALLPEVK